MISFILTTVLPIAVELGLIETLHHTAAVLPVPAVAR